MEATASVSSAPGALRAERPPRLALRFAIYTGMVLLVVAVAILWVLEREVEQRAEQRTEAQTQVVAEAALREQLRVADFARPAGPRRRRQLDRLFRDRVFVVGFVRATLFNRDGVVTYSTDHALIGRHRPSGELANALAGAHDRTEAVAGGRKVLRAFVPVRLRDTARPIGALALSQDYRVIDLQTRQAVRSTAFILGLALLALWASLIPILRRTTAQLHARNRQLTEQTEDLERALAARNRAEENAAELAAIVESSDDAIARTARDGTIVTWNSGAERLFGYSAREIVGRPTVTLVPPDRVEELSAVARRVNAGASVEDHETRGLCKDGTQVDVSLTVSPIRDAAGAVSGTAVIARDITHVKRQQAQLEALLAKERVARADAEEAQHALAEQNERLRELDRLKDEFISLVSHELRTPLTSIRGYLELVLEGGAGELTAEQERFLSVVQRNSGRLLQLVGDLLFMAQVEAGKLAIELDDIDMEEIVRECVEAAQPLANERHITLTPAVVQTPSMVGDRSRLAQVLDNLVSNALKFTPAGGRVDVRVSATASEAVIEVADTGVGIPADEQHRLFERFFRSSTATQQAIPGTGLGLTIAKAIVERHGGTISLETVEGEGTTVYVRIPARAAAAAAGATA
ncbi:MAG: PAS domain-containing sensor histidine kinase [Actinomycetota bacterium]|nr:PAS domain-containing sensor histidine kinase [Actinomycetota bacterium]